MTAGLSAVPVNAFRGGWLGASYRHYPPPATWRGGADVDVWTAALESLAQRPDDALAVEVHLPFCATRCLYCGCDVEATGDERTIAGYVAAMLREMDGVTAVAGRQREAVQIHFGGGTPNHLSDEQLSLLVAGLRERFRVPADAEWSIECDPRRCSATQMDSLRRLGFRHLRFGMGDLQPDVQHAVGRLQSLAMMDDVVAMARHARFDSVQVDLVYGLPLQTERRLRATLDALLRLGPDRIQCLPYLHEPSRFWPQSAIDRDAVPGAAARARQWEVVVETLSDAGYAWIGADLFVLDDDALATAHQRGELRRNALGYATVPAQHLLAFGCGRVSEVGSVLVASEPSRQAWQQALDAGRWPIVASHCRSAAERRRRRAIERLQCELALPAAIAAQGLAHEYERLAACSSLGWVVTQGDLLRVTRSGHLCLDALCAVLDGAARPPSSAAAAPPRVH